MLFTYTDVSYDTNGNRQEDDHDFTLVHVEIPGIVEHLPDRKDDIKGLEEVTHFGTYVADRLIEELTQTSPKAEPELT